MRETRGGFPASLSIYVRFYKNVYKATIYHKKSLIYILLTR